MSRPVDLARDRRQLGAVGLVAVAAGISVEKAQVDPGGSVTVTGEGCDIGVDVAILFAGSQVATATTGDDGTFSATFQVPAGTAPGTYTVEAVDCTLEVLSTTLTVLGAAQLHPRAELPQPEATPRAIPSTRRSRLSGR